MDAKIDTKNISGLTKIFISENNSKLQIIDKENNRFNVKSVLLWVYVILFCGISYISHEIIIYLKGTGKPEIFLNGYLLFSAILLVFKAIMISANIFFFSKDIENILPLPFKPIEILISKFNTLVYILYETEVIFSLVPFIMYGIYTGAGIMFYINLLFILFVLPLFIGLIISTIMIIIMKFGKIFNNKDIMQLLLSIILIVCMAIFMEYVIKYILINEEKIENETINFVETVNEKIIKINRYIVILNSCSKILQGTSFIKGTLIYGKIIGAILIECAVFIIVGKRLYLKNLLRSNSYGKKHTNKKIKIERKINKNSLGNFYIKKEFKTLVRNPIFLMQSISSVIINTIMISTLMLILIPKLNALLQSGQYEETMNSISFDVEAVCLILGGIQFITLFNFSSVISFSKEGKDAIIAKYLPVSLYKQFIYKNVPQVSINMLCSVILLAALYYIIPQIGIMNIVILFIISTIMILINSFILVVIDLINPNIKWDSEYEIFKHNKNKLLQYVLIIFNILLYIYIYKILKEINVNIALEIIFVISVIMFAIINITIVKKIKKLYKNIY